ncbi:MAG TPA: transglycosylase SLT domain-containing protein [Vicinamibacteria bacterium]|nr:transglycosylase SLT domain-containing protein [Vicinamibacteria bacterium]
MSWCGSWPGATRALSVRCSLRRSFPPAVAIALALLPWSAAGAHTWVDPDPANPQEAAVRGAIDAGPAGPARADALKRVADENPGSVAAGLAQLEAGLALVESGRAAAGIASLESPDVRRTALADYALAGMAEGYAALGQAQRAADSASALVLAHPQSPLLCDALSRGAEAEEKAARPARAVPIYERLLTSCPGYEPRTLLRLATLHARRGETKMAGAAYERLDREFPGSPEAREARRTLRTLESQLPAPGSPGRRERDVRKAAALADAGQYRDAVALLRASIGPSLTGPPLDEANVRMGRALVVLKREREAVAYLKAVPRSSALAAEAAFHLAKIEAKRTRGPQPYEAVVSAFPGTPWAEDALLNLANHYLKDGRDGEAAPYLARILREFPEGRYLDRATWNVGWWEYRSGRFQGAVDLWEKAARQRPTSGWAPQFLYWAARARGGLQQHDRAASLFQETVRRYKHTYHGLLAAQAMGGRLPAPAPAGAEWLPPADLPEPTLTRVHQLLLIDRLDEAREELSRVAGSVQAQSTLAWIEWKRGRLRPAITAMKRAHPEWKSEAGDRLPEEVWHIIYPLQHRDALVAQAEARQLDSSLVAAVIWQESTFDAGAVSTAGARGLMQVMPSTGRLLSRGLGRRPRARDLHDPKVSLELGTLYLKQMLDRFGGRVEQALAAYNAGPHRVNAWTAGRPDVPAEEFVESIPFTETRNYVMSILAHREHYRRLYGLGPAAAD